MGKHSRDDDSFTRGIPMQRDELLLRQQIMQEEESRQNAAPQPAPQFAPPASVPLFGRKKEILRLREEVARLTADNQRLYADNSDMTVRINQLGGMDVKQRDELIRRLSADLDRLNGDVDSRRAELRELNKTVLNLRDYAEFQEEGFYDYENPAENSVELSAKLAENKMKQKSMVKNKTAVHVTTGFTFNNSVSKGKKFLNDMSRMALSLYNAEAENCVKSVKAGNLDTSIKRLDRCHERIERFGKFIDLYITWEYQHLRIEELQLTAQYMQAVQAEKEAERERKAELREQAKAQKELEAEMTRLRKEQEHYQNVLEKMKEQGNHEEAAKLEARLAEIDKSINDVDYRAANIRAGYVYVISDVGAFGAHGQDRHDPAIGSDGSRAGIVGCVGAVQVRRARPVLLQGRGVAGDDAAPRVRGSTREQGERSQGVLLLHAAGGARQAQGEERGRGRVSGRTGGRGVPHQPAYRRETGTGTRRIFATGGVIGGISFRGVAVGGPRRGAAPAQRTVRLLLRTSQADRIG